MGLHGVGVPPPVGVVAVSPPVGGCCGPPPCGAPVVVVVVVQRRHRHLHRHRAIAAESRSGRPLSLGQGGAPGAALPPFGRGTCRGETIKPTPLRGTYCCHPQTGTFFDPHLTFLQCLVAHPISYRKTNAFSISFLASGIFCQIGYVFFLRARLGGRFLQGLPVLSHSLAILLGIPYTFP